MKDHDTSMTGCLEVLLELYDIFVIPMDSLLHALMMSHDQIYALPFLLIPTKTPNHHAYAMSSLVSHQTPRYAVLKDFLPAPLYHRLDHLRQGISSEHAVFLRNDANNCTEHVNSLPSSKRVGGETNLLWCL